MESHWTSAILQTVAVLIWCGRSLWRSYPAWTAYGLISSLQNLAIAGFLHNTNQTGAIWSVAAPIILIGLVDSVLELFLRLSELYRRFRRDRWRWLLVPVITGGLIGGFLVYPHLRLPSDYYRALFLANTAIGTICASVLLLCWIASVPARIPLNLRKHMLLLAIYVGTNTLAFVNYFNKSNQQTIQDLLVSMPPIVMLAWSLLIDPAEERQPLRAESEMPESTLEQIAGLLKRLT